MISYSENIISKICMLKDYNLGIFVCTNFTGLKTYQSTL